MFITYPPFAFIWIQNNHIFKNYDKTVKIVRHELRHKDEFEHSLLQKIIKKLIVLSLQSFEIKYVII